MKKVNKRVGEIIFKRNFYEEEIKHLNHSANKQKDQSLRLIMKKNKIKLTTKPNPHSFILFQQNAQ